MSCPSSRCATIKHRVPSIIFMLYSWPFFGEAAAPRRCSSAKPDTWSCAPDNQLAARPFCSLLTHCSDELSFFFFSCTYFLFFSLIFYSFIFFILAVHGGCSVSVRQLNHNLVRIRHNEAEIRSQRRSIVALLIFHFSTPPQLSEPLSDNDALHEHYLPRAAQDDGTRKTLSFEWLHVKYDDN